MTRRHRLPTPALWIREPGNRCGHPWATSPANEFDLWRAGVKFRAVLLIAFLALLAGCGEFPRSTDCKYLGRGTFDCGDRRP